MIALHGTHYEAGAGEIIPTQTRIAENFGADGLVRRNKMNDGSWEFPGSVFPHRHSIQGLLFAPRYQYVRTDGGQDATRAGGTPAGKYAAERVNMLAYGQGRLRDLAGPQRQRQFTRLSRVASPLFVNFGISWRPGVEEHQAFNLLSLCHQLQGCLER